MKFFKTKKSKVLLTCLAVILIASILCVSLVGCKSPLAGKVEMSVFFVGDFQSDISTEQLERITKDGAKIVTVKEALEQVGATDFNKNPAVAAAAIYAIAVTNYNNLTQSGYLVLTDAHVSARGTNVGNADVGIRSTFTAINGDYGRFSQTIAGVTQLDGIGPAGDTLRAYFGSNSQSLDNKEMSVSRWGGNKGANFPTKKDISYDINKLLLGAYNDNLKKSTDVTLTLAENKKPEEPVPEYIQPEGAMYPEKSTLKGIPLPSFNPNREPWEPLNRMPERYMEKGKVKEAYNTVEGTRYSKGNYGAGFATYDFSRPEYLSNDTKITYVEEFDLYTIEVKVKTDYVQQACEFAAGTLVNDTKDYIGLKNAKYEEASCKFEVYGDGLIKSMQKKDVLNSNEKCPVKVAGGILGDCKKGGRTSNKATMVFTYTDEDCDANKFIALYWPELGKSSKYKLVLPENKTFEDYTTYADYQPVVNQALFDIFTDLFTTKK